MGKPGYGGPVGKRSEERRRRNKPEGAELVKAPGAANVETPQPNAQWHAIAKRWFASLAESGQSRFYEPSDWATAEYVAESMSRNLKAGHFSATLFAAVMSAMSELLTTEGSRRRVRIELQRNGNGGGADAPPAGVTAINAYRDALGG